MAIKILTPVNDNVGVTANFDTKGLAKGTAVKITGDHAVDACASAGDEAIGYCFKAPREDDGEGTVQTRYGYLVEGRCDVAIAAGDHIQIGDTDSDGQQFKKYTGSDPHVDQGVCWIGAADGEVGTFLIY
jgi:hypothetical protein